MSKNVRHYSSSNQSGSPMQIAHQRLSELVAKGKLPIARVGPQLPKERGIKPRSTRAIYHVNGKHR